MSEEILSRLERIDHKEYSGGFEFADSSTFDEMARCFEERKILAKEIERLHSITKEVRAKLYDLNYKIKEIYNVPFDISEIFEMIEVLDKENNNDTK